MFFLKKCSSHFCRLHDGEKLIKQFCRIQKGLLLFCVGAPRPPLIFADIFYQKCCQNPAWNQDRTHHYTLDVWDNVLLQTRSACLGPVLEPSSPYHFERINRCWVLLLQFPLLMKWSVVCLPIFSNHPQFLFFRIGSQKWLTEFIPSCIIIPLFYCTWPCSPPPKHPRPCHYLKPPPTVRRTPLKWNI